MVSDGWLKTLLKALVYREGGVNNSGCRDMEVWTKANSYCRFFGAVLVWRDRMVLLTKNILGSEVLRRESIFSWYDCLGVTSMRHMGSQYMEQIINVMIIDGTRVPFQSI